MVKLTKPITQAIQEKRIMYWSTVPDSWGLELRAITCYLENGTLRSRLLAVRYEDADVMGLSKAIEDAGGLIEAEEKTMRLLIAISEQREQRGKDLRL